MLLIRSTLAFLLSIAAAQAIAWPRQLGDFAEIHDAVAAPGGGVLVAYTSFPCSAMRDLKNSTITNRMAIAKIGPDGTEAFSAELPWPEEERSAQQLGPRMGKPTAIAASGGDLFAAVEYRAGGPWLLRLTGDGRLLSMKRLTGLGEILTISKIVPAAEGNLYLLGTSDADLFIAKVTEPGQILWKRVVNLGAFEQVTDATATGNGGVTVVVNSGSPNVLRMNGNVIVLGFDGDGAVTGKYEAPGRYGSITRSEDGQYALVFDAAVTQEHDVRLRRLGAQLQEIGDEAVPAERVKLADFRVASVPGRGLVIVGAEGIAPVVIRTGERRAASRQAAAAEPSLRQQLVVSGNEVYIARTLIPAESNGYCMRATVSRLVAEDVSQ